MTIRNKAQIQSEIRKILTKKSKDQMKGVFEFLNQAENRTVNFQALYKKVLDGNELFLKKEKTLEEASSLLTEDDKSFLVKLLRHVVVYVNNKDQKKFSIPDDVVIDSINAGGVPAEFQTVPGANRDRILLYFHGGGWLLGSSYTNRLFTISLGKATKMRVLNVDYRLAPENPYPIPLIDCINSYKWLLSRKIKPKNIIIAGDSSGGDLTLATLVKLKNDKTPLPGGAICLSPITDLTFSDDLYFKKYETDSATPEIGVYWWFSEYISGADAHDPLISPLYADLQGLPPILIQVSGSEPLYSDAKCFFDRAKKAGIDVKLQVWDDMPHVFQELVVYDLKEAKEAIEKISDFSHHIFK